MLDPYPLSTFRDTFREFGNVPDARYGLYSRLAAKVFSDCFTQLLSSPCVDDLLGLFTAHYLWTVCNMEAGGTIKKVEGVNSAVTFESQSVDRFTSNLGLSPYGLLLQEMTMLDYFGSGEIMSQVCPC